MESINGSNNKIQDSDLAINQIASNLAADQRLAFFSEYDQVKKNLTSAFLLDLFLGGLGGHKFYLGQTGMGLLYLVLCWTGIPALIGIFELFTLSKQVKKYNEQKAKEIAARLLISSSQTPSLSELKIEGIE